MDSFGMILREKREEKNITIETVARETIISRYYIEALETENIDAFPGHTYIMGFLRNYSDYLGLDTGYMIKLFQGKLIQETPPPESLISHRRLRPKTVVLIIVTSALLACTVALLCVYIYVIHPQKFEDILVDLENKDGQEYTLSAIPFQRRVYTDDVLKLFIDGELVDVVVSDTLGALALETPVGLQFVELGEELEMNIDGKNGSDMVIFLSDISNTDESLGAEVRMFLKTGADADMSSIIDNNSIPLESNLELPVSSTQTIILEDNRAYPFTINTSFRDVCLYRYQGDRNDAIEGLFLAGETVTMQAQNAIRIWMSNANAVTMQLIAGGKTYALEIGRAGEVVVQDVRWIRESDNVYKLVVRDVE